MNQPPSPGSGGSSDDPGTGPRGRAGAGNAHAGNAHAGRAALVARGQPGDRPAWLRPTEGERRWPVGLALLVAIGLQLSVPGRYALHPQWIAPAVEAVVLIGMTIENPDRITRHEPVRRRFALGLLVLVAAISFVSLGLLVHDVTAGHAVRPVILLAGGAEIWLTNTIVFSLIYWMYDRGGPAARVAGKADTPDLLFPQMTDDHLAATWEPRYFDYLFVSFTNSTAFSPTDTMPLSRWCKALFMVQSAMSLVTVGLIAARAVNILPG